MEDVKIATPALSLREREITPTFLPILRLSMFDAWQGAGYS